MQISFIPMAFLLRNNKIEVLGEKLFKELLKIWNFPELPRFQEEKEHSPVFRLAEE